MDARISRDLLQHMLAHASETPEMEVCGLLLGDGSGRVAAVEPCANVASTPADSFEIDPAALFAALRRERMGGPSVIGCYHSHPHGLARPSTRDAAAAGRPGWLWLIIVAGDVAAWRETPGGSVEKAFEPVPLIAEAG
jgi:proteasome lid subunit RPN8/RPN11